MKFIPGDKVAVLKVTVNDYEEGLRQGDVGEVWWYSDEYKTYCIGVQKRKGDYHIPEGDLVLCNPPAQYTREHLECAFSIGEDLGRIKALKKFRSKEVLNDKGVPKFNPALFDDDEDGVDDEEVIGHPLWSKMERS